MCSAVSEMNVNKLRPSFNSNQESAVHICKQRYYNFLFIFLYSCRGTWRPGVYSLTVYTFSVFPLKTNF